MSQWRGVRGMAGELGGGEEERLEGSEGGGIVPGVVIRIDPSVFDGPMISLPLRKARVRWERPRFELAALRRVMGGGFGRLKPLPRGSTVAVTVGSRGVANIGTITAAIGGVLKGRGLTPFVVPAMGSHGGATAEGQVEVLASYGITEERVGCAVRSSMEVEELDSAGLEHPLYMDAYAAAADGVVVVNRIKPHTDFHGRYESGLCKMAVIGLGKRKQAEIMHGFGVRGLRDLVPVAAKKLLVTGRIWAGVGIVENAYDETAEVEVMAGEAIVEREPALLERARKNMARLPVDRLDVLLVDELGKNISGTGMDTGVIGRIRIPGEAEAERPVVRAIAVFGLTPESHGNAIGVGLADVISERLLRQIDQGVTRTNLVTSGFIERGKVPVAMATDVEAYGVALRTCAGVRAGEERVMRIRDTMHLEEVLVSRALEGELSGRADVEWVGGYEEAFDVGGMLRGW